MANTAEGWLSAAACRMGAGHALAPLPGVQLRELSPRQKRDVAGLAAAGIASTALVFAMLAVPGADGIALPSTPLRIQLAAAPVQSPAGPVQIAIPPARASRARQPRVLNALVIAARPLSAQVVPLTVRANIDPPELATTAPQNRVARVLFGDGRYRVRPFPTPADRN